MEEREEIEEAPGAVRDLHKITIGGVRNFSQRGHAQFLKSRERNLIPRTLLEMPIEYN